MEGADGQQVTRLAGWVVDHVVAEANFEEEGQLLVGDRDELVKLDLSGALPLSGGWGWAPDGEGRAFVIAGPESSVDGPWVWVVGSDDGPVASIEIFPDPAPADMSGELELLGNLIVDSGFIVIGNHTSIRWWGSRATLSTPENAAQFQIDVDIPGPLRDSYILVASVATGSVCRVLGRRDRRGQFVELSIQMPAPSWLPHPLPLSDD
jgi:hypothetical protein